MLCVFEAAQSVELRRFDLSDPACAIRINRVNYVKISRIRSKPFLSFARDEFIVTGTHRRSLSARADLSGMDQPESLSPAKSLDPGDRWYLLVRKSADGSDFLPIIFRTIVVIK